MKKLKKILKEIELKSDENINEKIYNIYMFR
jgi:hypothetical protein